MRSIVFLCLLGLLPGSILGQGSTTAGAKAPDSSAKTDKYAAESVVHERASTVYRYAADGTGSREITLVSRMQSEAAARQFGVVVIPFAGNNEHVEIDYVRVRKPDGTVVETPVTDAQEMPLEVTRQAPFYSDLKEKQLPVRNLRMGDKLEYKVRIIRTKPEAPGEFWGQESFGYGGTGQVMLEETVELRVPKGKYVKVWSPKYSPAVSDESGETVYRWKSAQLEPTVKPDGKANTKEVDPDGELPSVAWTTFKSWQEVGAWYQSLEADRIVADPDVKAKVVELIAGKTTDEEKVRALYGYVALQIRYIGVAFGIGRFQPHSAGDVLRNQYGDCKDKHTLLAAMLREAGLHPDAVLIGAGIRMNEDVPSPASFNHAITTLPVGGKQVWLDSTAEVAPYQVLIATIRDKQALVIPENSPAKLDRTPAVPPFPFVDSFIATGTLSKDGTMKSHLEFVSRGDTELIMRAVFRMIAPGQWEQFTEGFSERLGLAGTTSHTEATRPDATEEPFKLSYDYEKEKYSDWDNYKILPLFPITYLPSVDEKDPPKTTPIELGSPRVELARTIIKLPAGWGAESPKDIHEKTAFASFDKTYKIDHDTLTVERRIEVLQKRVPAADWKAYKKWYDATLSDSEKYIQLTSTGTKAEEKGPPLAGSNNDEAAKLVKEAFDDLQYGAPNKAEAALDAAKKLNDKQPNLWGAYGAVEFERRNWNKAAEYYKKEIDLYPRASWAYGALSQAQIRAGHFDEALETLRTFAKNDPENQAADKALAGLLEMSRQYDEEVRVLKPIAAKSPDDGALQMQLGIAEINSGNTTDGTATLLTALKNATDSGPLNNGAYALADAGVELEAAEKSARKAIDLLTAESANWTLENIDNSKQKASARLLLASWDTLGWVFYRENKLDEAEAWVLAAWLNQPSAEESLHLGEIEEKRGQLPAALGLYEFALGSRLTELPKGITLKTPDKITAYLNERIAQLKKMAIRPDSIDQQKIRTLSLGKSEPHHGTADYRLILSGGHIAETFLTSSGQIPSAASDVLVRRAPVSTWTPPGSTARIPRNGFLNCHSNTCELVFVPLT